MGFFDLFSDVKENMDKSRQAKEYIRRAKELVREGDDIYEKAYNKVTSYALETKYRLYEHTNYKKEIAKELGGTIGITLQDFRQFNIDAKTITAPSVKEIATGSCVQEISSEFESAMSNFMPHLDTPSIFDMFISDSDYYEAKYKREEARQYKERMKMERDKLNSYREKMSEIRSFISSEKSELDSLMRKLKKMISELKGGMQKSSFSIEEADYLKGIHKIAECIVTLLSTDFLSDTFYISQRYEKIFLEVKNINQSIPYSPSISDVDTASAIKHIIDNVIIY